MQVAIKFPSVIYAIKTSLRLPFFKNANQSLGKGKASAPDA